LAWTDYEVIVREQSVNWRAPAFYSPNGMEWDFLRLKRQEDPFLATDLGEVIGAIDSVAIFRLSNGFGYELELEGLLRQ
jgi:hypothetical protein